MVSLKQFKDWFKLQRMELDLQSLAIGVNSTVDITKDVHIVMLDYDIKDLDLVKESVKELQLFWRLSDAEVFQTRNGHHVFFWFDHVPYGRLKLIIEYAKYVDPMYKYISRYYDHKTIRVSGKYPEKDIKPLCWVVGKRRPSRVEKEIGDLKRLEHIALR